MIGGIGNTPSDDNITKQVVKIKSSFWPFVKITLHFVIEGKTATYVNKNSIYIVGESIALKRCQVWTKVVGYWFQLIEKVNEFIEKCKKKIEQNILNENKKLNQTYVEHIKRHDFSLGYQPDVPRHNRLL